MAHFGSITYVEERDLRAAAMSFHNQPMFATTEDELRALAAGQAVHSPWSPFDIRLMLHFYATPSGQFEQAHAPIYAERVQSLVDAGLIQADGETYSATEKGRFLVLLWRETPVPAVRYVDPRHD